ncbi:MAG: hypothetical protein D6824_06380 [Planctomycetota bacterium]|nr:MAG: hypothetical protein D6824_06380 [Planctomycetota bacterium]
MADGEAPEEIVRELENDERAQRAVAFERTLRRKVAEAMRAEAAPSQLRRRVEALFAERRSDDEGDAATVGPAATRSRAFWSRRSVVGWTAVAAVAALTATLSVIFVRRAARPTLPAQVVAFLEQEHNRCVDLGDYFEQKMVARDEEEAAALLQKVLASQRGPAVDLRGAGFLLLGAGPCHVPGEGPSAHLLYGPAKSTVAARPLSVFVQRLPSSSAAATLLRPGVCYETLCGENQRDVVAAWRVGEVMVYVYCPDGASRLPAKALRALGAPSQRVALGA